MALKIKKQTISDQIVEYFRNKIEKGKMMPGDPFPSERQLEKELNISRKTINKAISILAGQGYVFKIQGKTTYVAEWKQSRVQSGGSSKKIGLVFDHSWDVMNPFWSKTFQLICDKLAQKDYGINLLYESRERDYEVKKNSPLTKALENREVEGVIIFMSAFDQKYPKELLEESDMVFASIVPYNFRTAFPEKLINVYADDVGAVGDAVNYLKKSNHERIAFLYGFPNWPCDLEKIKVFKQSFMKKEYEICSKMLFPCSYSQAETVENTLKILKKKPTAIICADDIVARWVIETVNAQGLKVPDDISIIGFNDMEMYSCRKPGLTTFKYPYEKVAEKITDLLIDAIEGKINVGLEDHRFPYTFVKRDTTKRLKKK